MRNSACARAVPPLPMRNLLVPVSGSAQDWGDTRRYPRTPDPHSAPPSPRACPIEHLVDRDDAIVVGVVAVELFNVGLGAGGANSERVSCPSPSRSRATNHGGTPCGRRTGGTKKR